MGLASYISKTTGEDSDNKGSGFQLIWFALHLSAAILHTGSALYHMRRVRHDDSRPERAD